jgi:hypothetical protein
MPFHYKKGILSTSKEHRVVLFDIQGVEGCGNAQRLGCDAGRRDARAVAKKTGQRKPIPHNDGGNFLNSIASTFCY